MVSNEKNRGRMETYNRRKRNRRRRNLQMLLRGIVFFCFVIVFIVLFIKFFPFKDREMIAQQTAKFLETKEKITLPEPEFTVDLLTPNEYSRPQIALEKIKGIVIHYTANPGTTAQQNRDYFEGLKDTGELKVSSHFVIGLEGEIIQCIPTKEISYASNERNQDTIAIECCHPEEDGIFTGSTYNSLVELTAWLLVRNELTTADLLRHYDITGKLCPVQFVDEEEWKAFKNDVQKFIDQNAIET